MKTLIHEVAEASGHNYQLFAELVPAGNYNHLKFTTVWDGAKDPAASQNKFQAFLTADAINKLIAVLETANEVA